MVPQAQSTIQQTTATDAEQVATEVSIKLPPPLAFNAKRSPWKLLLQIGIDNSPALHLELASQIAVGRSDIADGYAPELDLTEYGALDSGVSRHHALIYVLDGMLYVRDMCSTNGTRINDKTLMPNKAYPLHENDVIEFGQLRVKLTMARPPR
ncbi:MAG TPA: FHA domain-containing protein [Aggregatilineales bacterium]|nr:FHA domain-containing protein [Aggregatilineales bacterium]